MILGLVYDTACTACGISDLLVMQLINNIYWNQTILNLDGMEVNLHKLSLHCNHEICYTIS